MRRQPVAYFSDNRVTSLPRLYEILQHHVIAVVGMAVAPTTNRAPGRCGLLNGGLFKHPCQRTASEIEMSRAGAGCTGMIASHILLYIPQSKRLFSSVCPSRFSIILYLLRANFAHRAFPSIAEFSAEMC
jgi:hypothetical protein